VIVRADARHLPLRDECVQCVVTSPPYWGLRKYDGEQGSEPFGLEASFKLYIEHSLDILGEIRRVLKPDGVVFWNIDDCYAGGHVNYSGSRWTHVGSPDVEAGRVLGKLDGLKPKDLCLIPERVAIELNRRAISVDLAYHSQAEKRTRNVQRRLKGLA
jgi:hypothetical protein